ncbi:MEDS domain-containing protein [Amycolatopsis sp.]|uniref:MEDS domain-containing protein n=1 Tax=Amycolatopsis sp. TaxID=37632 RepID=UPI002E0ADB65|nr:MEDS domain-containing protein [Amycolatopsis sp.]
MNLSGEVVVAVGLGPHDHVCWAYDDPAVFRDRAVEFVTQAVAGGYRVFFVADDEFVRAHLAGFEAIQEAVRRGAVRIDSIAQRYTAGDVIDPERQVEIYAAATESALAVGYAGLRAVADVTRLVGSPEQLDAFARYESLVDRYTAGQPFSALCAYNRTELGDEVIAQVACLHPKASAGATPFHLHAPRDAEAGTLELSGELDLLSREVFPLALDRVDSRATESELVIDATGLRFVDHNSMLALSELADRREATVVLRTSGLMPARLVEILDLRNVRVEAPL